MRARNLLKSAGIPFSERIYQGVTEIKIKWSDAPEYMKAAKVFDHRLLLHNPNVFIDEIRYWDGSMDLSNSLTGVEYTTTVQDNALWVATMAHLAGRAASITPRIRSNKGWSPSWRVYIRDQMKTRISPSEISPEWYKGDLYCPVTKTGYFLVRYNGKIHVTGNSGAGIQPQNFPSKIKVSADPEEMLAAIQAGGLKLHNALYDDDPMSTAGALTRSVLTAGPGKELIVADYSSIEGRGLAWEAGEESEIQTYMSDKDVYIATAASILHKPYEAITKEERQSPGKVASLACGYGGSAGAVRKFNGDVPYRKRWAALLSGEELETRVDEDIVCEIVRPWREAHPKTVEFWYALEEACMSAVENPGQIFTARAISFISRKPFMLIRLPSGRMLYYYDPDIRKMMTSWGEEKASVTYMTVDSLTKKWVRTNTYGGKLAENCIAEGSLVLTDSGWKPIEHIEKTDLIHDGCGFVPHGGKVLTSIQACISIDGVLMTPDHEVLTYEGWKAASSNPRPYRPNIRDIGGYWTRAFRRQETLLDFQMPMREIGNESGDGGYKRNQTRGNPELRMPNKIPDRGWESNPRDDFASGLLGMAIDAGSMSAFYSSSLAQLRSTGDKSLRTLVQLCKFLGRYGRWVCSRVGVGSQGQRWPLFPRELSLDNSNQSSPESQKQCVYRNPFGEDDRSRSLASLQDRGYDDSLSDCKSLEVGRALNFPQFSSTKQKVYDILNCGPRSRFVVKGKSGPFIVHNCTQAICRDIMADAMLRLESAGYPIILTVHDEIISEVDKGFGSVEEYVKLMCEVPNWATGFPINAKGFRSFRYRKD